MTQRVDVIKLKTIPSHCSLVHSGDEVAAKAYNETGEHAPGQSTKGTLGYSDWWVHNVGEWSQRHARAPKYRVSGRDLQGQRGRSISSHIFGLSHLEQGRLSAVGLRAHFGGLILG